MSDNVIQLKAGRKNTSVLDILREAYLEMSEKIGMRFGEHRDYSHVGYPDSMFDAASNSVDELELEATAYARDLIKQHAHGPQWCGLCDDAENNKALVFTIEAATCMTVSRFLGANLDAIRLLEMALEELRRIEKTVPVRGP
jgi:hypothetical protein